MSVLHVCNVCGRHVREDACPFCGAREASPPARNDARVARAVLFAGAAILTTAACAMNGYGGPPPDDPASHPATNASGGSDASLATD